MKQISLRSNLNIITPSSYHCLVVVSCHFFWPLLQSRWRAMANLPFLELHVSDVVDRYDDQLHLPCGLQSFRKAAADGVCLFAQLRPDFWHLSQ